MTMTDAAADAVTLPPTIERIIMAVCAVTGYDRAHLMSSQRTRDVAEARMMVYALAREFGHGLIAIGRYMRRDHTTVLYGAREFVERASGDSALALMLARARTAAVTGGRAATAPQPEKRDEPAAAAPADAGPDGELDGGMAMPVMAAAAACGIAHEEICDRSQSRAFIVARQIAAMLMHDQGVSLGDIAQRLQRDTATILHGLHMLRNLRKRDAAVAEAWGTARDNIERLRAGQPARTPPKALGAGHRRRAVAPPAHGSGHGVRPGAHDDVALVCRDGKWDLVANTARAR